MQTRQDIEQHENDFLAGYAVKSGDSQGRMFEEDEHPFRTRFQRDRDRVVHSQAFRRLEYKTQVFVNHEGDYYRTRLTHSLEVAQIARSMARNLRLNEDLAEAVSLAHDLGHTPFGHSGQDVMNRLMKDFGGFEHNRQSFRVVTFLEARYSDFLGLNLTYELLEGITKHVTEYDMPDGSQFVRKGYPSLEAQICNFADEIAYNNHDIDDGLKSGMLDIMDLKQVEIWQSHFERVQSRYPHESLAIHISQTVKSIINTLVTDLITQTELNIADQNIKTVQDVYERGKGLVGFSEEVRRQSIELKKFLYGNLYCHYRVLRMADKAERIISQLFETYIHHPKIIPPSFLSRYRKDKNSTKIDLKNLDESVERIVCDYIAGMTDRFALDEYKKLFDPHEKV